MPNRIYKDERELVQALKGRQEGALEAAYDRYSDALYGVISRIVNDDAVAADILQDVIVKVWKHIDKYDESKGRLFTWLINIARNAAIDHLRSSSHKSASLIQNVQDSVGMIERSYPEQMEVEHIGIRELVDKLEPDQRELIDLAYYRGYTQSELSEELNLPLGTVKSRMRAGLKVLKGWMS